ncbi:hypothetical protein HDV00_007900 [Rhizophlyctis rosea]|nr:hypothetical protein HDV00_007900 [Rhizophlyctis rosea]
MTFQTWQPNVFYPAGTIVQHNGQQYRTLQHGGHPQCGTAFWGPCFPQQGFPQQPFPSHHVHFGPGPGFAQHGHQHHQHHQQQQAQTSQPQPQYQAPPVQAPPVQAEQQQPQQQQQQAQAPIAQAVAQPEQKPEYVQPTPVAQPLLPPQPASVPPPAEPQAEQKPDMPQPAPTKPDEKKIEQQETSGGMEAPQPQNPPPNQVVGGYPTHTSQQQEQVQKAEKESGHSRKKLIAGGLLGAAVATGIGAVAYKKFQDHKEEEAAMEWNERNWRQEAAERQKAFLEAVQKNEKLPPTSWILTEGNNIPQGALIGGNEADGRPLYIARAFHKNGVHVGKAAHHLEDGAHIAYGGKEISKSAYEVLCGFENAVKWVDGHKKLKLDEGMNLVEGGKEGDGTPLFIAQALHKDSIVPGKCGPHLDDGAMIPYGGDECTCKNYRYLVYA